MAAEVVSPGSGSERVDRVRKVGDYATVGIPQHWIVDHRAAPRVQVLTLDGQACIATPAVGCGAVLTAEIDADKPFEVSFDPAVLLEF